MKLSDLAAALDCTLRGDPQMEISGVAGMEHAGPSHLTFLANPKYAPKVKNTRAGAILVLKHPSKGCDIAQLISTESLLRFRASAGDVLSAAASAAGNPSAGVRGEDGDRSARMPPSDRFAVVGEHVTLGRNAVLHPHVVHL